MRGSDVDVENRLYRQEDKDENGGDDDEEEEEEDDDDDDDEVVKEEVAYASRPAPPGIRGGNATVLRSRTNTAAVFADSAAATTPIGQTPRRFVDLQKTPSASSFSRPFGFASSASGRGSSVRLFMSSVPPSAKGKTSSAGLQGGSPLNTPTRIPGGRPPNQPLSLLQTPGTTTRIPESSSAKHQMLTVTPVSNRLDQLRENGVATTAATTPKTPVPSPKTDMALRPHVFATPRTPTSKRTPAPPLRSTMPPVAPAAAVQSAGQRAAQTVDRAAMIAHTKTRIKACRFFFDCADQRVSAHMSKQVKELGATVELFMSNKVTHLITTKPIPAEPVTVNSKAKTPSRSPAAKKPADLVNKASPVSVKNGLFLAGSRSKGIEDNITSARKFGAHVWPLERLQTILKAVNGVAAPRKLQDHLRDEKLYGISTTRDAEHQKVKYRVFKERYLIIEDIAEAYRPIMVKEYHEAENPADPPWPVMSLKDRPGGCPFLRYPATEPHNAPSSAALANGEDCDMPPTIRLEDTVTGDHASESDAAKDAPTEQPSNPHHRVSAASGLVSMSAAVPQRLAAIKTAAVKQLDKRELAVKPGRKARPGSAKQEGLKAEARRRDHRVVGKAFYTRSGYCENCNLKYELFTEHVRSNAHKAWLAQANFQDLDNLLAKIARRPKKSAATASDVSVKRVRVDSVSTTSADSYPSARVQPDCASVTSLPAAKRPRLKTPTPFIESACHDTPANELSAPLCRSAQTEAPCAKQPVTPAVSSANPDTLSLSETAALAAEPPQPSESAEEAHVRQRTKKTDPPPVQLPPSAPPTSESLPLPAALSASASLSPVAEPNPAEPTVRARRPPPVTKSAPLPPQFPRPKVPKPPGLPPCSPVASAPAAHINTARSSPAQSPHSMGIPHSVGSPLQSETSTPPDSPAAAATGRGILGRTKIAVPTNSPRGRSMYSSPHRRHPPPQRFGMRNDPQNPFVEPQRGRGRANGGGGGGGGGGAVRGPAVPVVASNRAAPLPAWPRVGSDVKSMPPALSLTLPDKTSSPVSEGRQDVSVPVTPCRPSPSLEMPVPPTLSHGVGNGRDASNSCTLAVGLTTFQNPRLNLVYDMTATSPLTTPVNSDPDTGLLGRAPPTPTVLQPSSSSARRRRPSLPLTPLLAAAQKREAGSVLDRRRPVKRVRLILGPKPQQDTSPARLHTDADNYDDYDDDGDDDDDDDNDDEEGGGDAAEMAPDSPTTTDFVERDGADVFGVPPLAVTAPATMTMAMPPGRVGAGGRRGSCQLLLQPLRLKIKTRPRSMSASAEAGESCAGGAVARETVGKLFDERSCRDGLIREGPGNDSVTYALSRPREEDDGLLAEAAPVKRAKHSMSTRGDHDEAVADEPTTMEADDGSAADVSSTLSTETQLAADAPIANANDDSAADVCPSHTENNASVDVPTVHASLHGGEADPADSSRVLAEEEEPDADEPALCADDESVVDASTLKASASRLSLRADDDGSDAATATLRADDDSAADVAISLADDDELVANALTPRAAPLEARGGDLTLEAPSSPCLRLPADSVDVKTEPDVRDNGHPRVELEMKESTPVAHDDDDAGRSTPPDGSECVEPQDSCSDTAAESAASQTPSPPRPPPTTEDANVVAPDADTTPRAAARFWRPTSDFMRVVLNSDDEEAEIGNGANNDCGVSSPASSALSTHSSRTTRAKRASWAAALAAERQKRADAWRRSRQRVLPFDGAGGAGMQRDWHGGTGEEEEPDEFDALMMTSSMSVPDHRACVGEVGGDRDGVDGTTATAQSESKPAILLSRDPAWYYDLCVAVGSEPISSEGDH
ncbi:hypothetical protein HDU87_003589 [Geranomyces variabilis]|uniref:DBF4-type domain-containing protein n=1 Tax=Geranomyces variabilis TaxID=109894 RepID=A0AAD5TKQ3_9FUNG|nr:hypothetical protein HDU87_003589 [Geranomyces variabilis]